MFNRSSGVLLHISSLPSPYGIGTMGKEAYRFVDFLRDAGQTYWQVLPLGQTGFGNSPYQCYSAAAGNPFFIDLCTLAESGLLTQEDLNEASFDAVPDYVNYDKVAAARAVVLRRAYDRAKQSNERMGKLEGFRMENADWVVDYAMFMAIKQKFGEKPVWEWDDEEIKHRDPEAMRRYTFDLKDEVDYYIFLQQVFFEQWHKLREYANKQGIRIIGDIPIYVSPDSCDIWAHPDLFQVDKDLRASGIAGVPPDYYSETGQLWGNPTYNWKEHANTGYAWWIWRVKRNLALFDVNRIDHFRGFYEYWEVPVGEETAVNGKWMKGPKMKLFKAITEALGDVPIIAEDLGDIDDNVRKFLKKSGYPGMRVLIFGLNANEDNVHLPHNWIKNCIGYSSTHDSETIRQQYEDICSDADRAFAREYLRLNDNEPMAWSAIRTVYASPAVIAMTPMQDVLNLGADARMNTPATIGGNWAWRVRSEAINDDVAAFLRRVAYGNKRINPTCPKRP